MKVKSIICSPGMDAAVVEVVLSKDPREGDGPWAPRQSTSGPSACSISDNRPVQRFCSGKLTVTSPFCSIPTKNLYISGERRWSCKITYNYTDAPVRNWSPLVLWSSNRRPYTNAIADTNNSGRWFAGFRSCASADETKYFNMNVADPVGPSFLFPLHLYEWKCKMNAWAN